MAAEFVRLKELRDEETHLRNLVCTCGHQAWVHEPYDEQNGCLSFIDPETKEPLANPPCSCSRFVSRGEA